MVTWWHYIFELINLDSSGSAARYLCKQKIEKKAKNEKFFNSVGPTPGSLTTRPK